MVSDDIEKRLWAAADQLWANTGLKPAQFSTPFLGLIGSVMAEMTSFQFSSIFSEMIFSRGVK